MVYFNHARKQRSNHVSTAASWGSSLLNPGDVENWTMDMLEAESVLDPIMVGLEARSEVDGVAVYDKTTGLEQTDTSADAAGDLSIFMQDYVVTQGAEPHVERPLEKGNIIPLPPRSRPFRASGRLAPATSA